LDSKTDLDSKLERVLKKYYVTTKQYDIKFGITREYKAWGRGKRLQKFCFLLNPDGVAHCAVLTYPDKQKFNMA
jgi:hypothetical protein